MEVDVAKLQRLAHICLAVVCADVGVISLYEYLTLRLRRKR